MARLLVDTDILVDHLRGARELRPGGSEISYSVITRCELFSGTDDENDVNRLLAPFQEIPVDRGIAELGGRLRRETGIRTPDALIAATALAHELSLCTRNRRDFEPIAGLEIT